MNASTTNAKTYPAMQPRVPGRGPAAKSPEGEEALAVIWQQKWAKARKGVNRSRIFALACFVGAPICIYLFGPNGWTFGIFLGVVMAGDVARVDDLTETEYYSVPGSRDKAGKHRCIYCGHKGIETHYYGRAQTLKAIRCHACQRHLF